MHMQMWANPSAKAATIVACVVAVLAAIVASLPAAAAAKCGAENKRPCSALERIPSCDPGLVEDFINGLCRARSPTKAIIGPRPANCGGSGMKPCPVPHIPSCNGRLVEDFTRGICRQSDGDIVNMAKDTLAQSGALIRETALALGRCTALEEIIAGGGSKAGKATQLQQQPCVREMIEGARRAGYRSFSLGIGGGASFGLGADTEAGFVFDTAYRNPPAFYTSYGYSLGIQAGTGGNLVAGYGRSPNFPATSQGHGATIGFAAAGGAGASAWYNYDGSPSGISVMAAAGAEFSIAYGRNETRITAIPGAQPIPDMSGGAPNPAMKSITGNYYFTNDPNAVNSFRMASPDLLQAANLKNGAPVKWFDYVRIDATTFRARGGTQSYQILDNGDLLWRSNGGDNTQIVLRRR